MRGRLRSEGGGLRCAGTLALCAALLWLALPSAAAKPARRAAKKIPPALDQGAYDQGHRHLDEGDLERATDAFCRATAPARESGWSLSVALLCDPTAIHTAVRALMTDRKEPVFILAKIYKGTPCYRLCVGLTADRNSAAALAKTLPAGLRKSGPFPFPLREACHPAAATVGEEHPGPTEPSNVVAPPSQQAAAPEVSPAGTTSDGAGIPAAALPEEALPSVPKEAPAATGEPAAAPDLGPMAPRPAPADTETAEPAPPAAEESAPAAPPPPVPSPVEAPVQPEAAPLATAPPDLRPEAPPQEDPSEPWFQKGLRAQEQGRFDEAQADYERALALRPDKPETLNNLAVLHLRERRYAEAKDLLERAVDVAPAYGRAHLNLAGALWGLDRRQEAVEHARLAAKYEPGDTAPHLTLASFLVSLDRHEEARAEAKAVLALEPGNAGALQILKEIGE